MTHPYAGIPPHQRWDRGVAQLAPSAVDPVIGFPFTVTPTHRIVTAGSCFAQHIARYLKSAGFAYLVTEAGHPLLAESGLASAYNYGVYTARFGNLYTSRQLEQLFLRAYGRVTPQDTAWETAGGRLVDPFRPTIQPGGFLTFAELEADRRQHLAAVRQAFEQLDVFIFTLGLTECWTATADGAVFPLAPGVAGGEFDAARYAFLNLSVDDVAADMSRFVTLLREVNPAARVILTVSPVPLNATAVARHVLVSTAYSKAVLRIAAERLVETFSGVYYFPAYEIVTGAFNRGQYFADDLRSVTEAGVQHVMSLFFAHATTAGRLPDPPAGEPAFTPVATTAAEKALEVLCDEELLTLQNAPGMPRQAPNA